MGKGDQRSKRGKIYRGTHGKSRPKKHEGEKGAQRKAKEKNA